MRDNVKIVAILNIVWGCLGALGGIVVLMVFGGLASMAGFANDRDAAAAVPIFALIGTCVAIFLFIVSVPAILGGWGMLKFRPWARILMIIVSALHLLNIPIGTALGIYGLIILLNDETRRLFETGGAYVPAPQYAGQAPYGQPGYGPQSGYGTPGSSPAYVPPAGYPQQPSYPQQPPPPPTPGS